MARKAFRPKKRFGQNFLYDPSIAARLVESAGLQRGQTVVELGAGKGILTKPLAESGVHVIAVELDRDLHEDLVRNFGAAQDSAGGPVEVIHVDFTRISLTGLLASRGLDRCVLMGNIPYHLTREVFFSFLVDECEMLEAAYIMVQREVGERVVSAPGSRLYGIPSVILQSLYSVRILFKVSAGSFHPRPNVDSVVLQFRPLEQPLVQFGELDRFIRFVKNVFQQRRKRILSTIRSFYALTEAELKTLHRDSGIDLSQRPEELSKEELLRLSKDVAALAAASGAKREIKGRR